MIIEFLVVESLGVTAVEPVEVEGVVEAAVGSVAQEIKEVVEELATVAREAEVVEVV